MKPAICCHHWKNSLVQLLSTNIFAVAELSPLLLKQRWLHHSGSLERFVAVPSRLCSQHGTWQMQECNFVDTKYHCADVSTWCASTVEAWMVQSSLVQYIFDLISYSWFETKKEFKYIHDIIVTTQWHQWHQPCISGSPGSTPQTT